MWLLGKYALKNAIYFQALYWNNATRKVNTSSLSACFFLFAVNDIRLDPTLKKYYLLDFIDIWRISNWDVIHDLFIK